MKTLMTGNEAVARGAWEAGATAAFGYPGTPSTEILENLVNYKDDVYVEWAPNEKVAFEAATGASYAGARTIVTMKHVGLNVAADPLMTLSYVGSEGGMLICVADDPGQHSSQNEQDSRHFARFAKIPVLEPADSDEALRCMRYGFELSEKHKTPVMIRLTTRVSHSRGLAMTGERSGTRAANFERNPSRFCPLPVWGREMRKRVEIRTAELARDAERHPLNRIEKGNASSGGELGAKLGIIAEGLAYNYVKEVFPDASVLKLGFAWPYPDDLIREFAGQVDRLVVIEENEDILEEHVRAMGIDCVGRDMLSGVGELSVPKLLALRDRLEGKTGTDVYTAAAPIAASADLPARPPVLCPGCPHRGLFFALTKHDVLVTGDIGCYSLAVFPPLSRTDTILCMGGGFSVAQGIDKAGEKRRVVGVVGDSTFFHSGITGLLDVVYNKGKSVLVVLDNRTTAMTGHQDHPGTGMTLMGEATTAVSIEEVGRACGMKNVATVNPYDLATTQKAVNDALASDETSLIVTRAPCPLRTRKPVGAMRSIDQSKCKSCHACLKLGCPAIESTGKGTKPYINAELCAGCNLCEQVCAFAAIATTGAGASNGENAGGNA
jgi:indolepyruvate ferredoxin oxidoreductase alpha subunit